MGQQPSPSRSRFQTIDSDEDSRRGLLERLRFVNALLREAVPPLHETCLLYRNADGRALAAPVAGDLLVGRGASAGLQLADPRLSSLHFRVCQADGRMRLSDQQSRNGTWVNGHRVETKELCDGDVIEAGSQLFVFVSAL